MRKLILFCFILTGFFLPVKAQQVTLQVHQHDPILIVAPHTTIELLQGDKITLGKDLVITGGSGIYTTIWSSPLWSHDSIQPTITVSPSDTTEYLLRVTDTNHCSAEQLFRVNVFLPLQGEVMVSPVTCYGKNDGSAFLSIRGGVPPYNIIWSDGSVNQLFSGNLAPGEHSVSVTDELHALNYVVLFMVHEPEPIKHEWNAAICQGNSYLFGGIARTQAGQYQQVVTTVNGCDSTLVLHLSVEALPEVPVIAQKGDTLFSSASERIQWLKEGVEIVGENKPTLVIAQSGNYSVKVTNASGCSITSDVFDAIKTEIPPLQIECQVSAITCYGQNNGSARISLTGGTAPYLMKWSNGETTESITGLTPGDYMVTVTDAVNQKVIKSVTVTEPSPISVELNVFLCQGTSYLFGGIERHEAGQYQHVLKSVKGCDSTLVLNLSVESLPVAAITQKGDTLFSSSPAGNQWIKEGVEMEGENKPSLVISQSGNYAVTVTNAMGCYTTSDSYAAIKTDSPVLNTTGFSCHVYPNPNNGLFTVEVESDQSNTLVLELLSADGKSVQKQKLQHGQGRQTIEFGKVNLAEGAYTLLVQLGKQSVSRKLIVHP